MSCDYDNLNFMPASTGRLTKGIDLQDFIQNRCAHFEVAQECNPAAVHLENEEDAKEMRRQMIESQLKWNDEPSACPTDVDYNKQYFDDFDAISSTMIDVKLHVDGLRLPLGAVKKRMIKRGCGTNAQCGDLVWVSYKMFVEHMDEPVDSTYVQGFPKRFTVGNGEVIAGFDAAIVGMNEGQIDLVLISPEYAFGPLGCNPRIPPNARLLTEILINRIHHSGAEQPVEDLTREERLEKGFEAVFAAAEKRKKIGNDFLTKHCDQREAIKEYMRASELANELMPVTDHECFLRDKLVYHIQVNLALAFLQINKFRKAIMHCNEALACPIKDTLKTKAYFRLAKSLHESGKIEESMEPLRRAYGLNRNDPTIKKFYEQVTKQIAFRLEQERAATKKMFGNMKL